jgi:hypothetical protein
MDLSAFRFLATDSSSYLRNRRVLLMPKVKRKDCPSSCSAWESSPLIIKTYTMISGGIIE